MKHAINFGERVEKLAEGNGLVKGSIRVPGQRLLYSDVLNGGVFSIDRQGNVTTVFAYRKGIGGMSVHENGGMIVSGRNVSWKSVPEGDTIPVLDQNKAAGLISFNYITTDDVGRIYA